MTHENTQQKDKGVLRQDQNQLILEKGFSFSGYERDPLYLNLGGKKFKEISGVSGIDSITDGRAAVFADFDNDGDLDVFLRTIQGRAALLFRNNVGQDNNFLRVTLEGTKSGRDSFGAVVRVKTSAGTLTKIKAGGAGYLSQHDPRLLFGLGKDARAEWIEVTWPSGRIQRFENIPANCSLRLVEGRRELELIKEKRSRLPDPLNREELLLRTLKLRKGEQFPAIEVTTLDGRRALLSSLAPKGSKILLNVWATWCLPCAKEMPELERLQPQLKANNVRVVGLSIDTDGPEVVPRYLQRFGITYPIFLADERAIAQIYVTDEASVPLSILLDEEGKVTEVFGGWSKQSMEKLERLAKTETRER